MAVAVAGLVGAVVYGLVTGGDPVGVISVGYKGGVGDHLGYAILLFGSLAGFMMALISIIARDGEAEELAALAGTEVAPPVIAPRDRSYWGLLTGFGLAFLMLGVSVGSAFLYLGLAVM